MSLSLPRVQLEIRTARPDLSSEQPRETLGKKMAPRTLQQWSRMISEREKEGPYLGCFGLALRLCASEDRYLSAAASELIRHVPERSDCRLTHA